MSSALTLTHGRLHLPNRLIPDGSLTIIDGKIAAISDDSQMQLPRQGRMIDLEGALVCPGFIDLHCNGGGGALFMDATPDAVRAIACAHASSGTTGILATTVAWDEHNHLQAVREASRHVGQDTGGAKILGVHMEGPFLNPKKAGAHDPNCLLPATIPHFQKYLDASAGTLRMLTLAPEVDGAMDVIRYARAHGVCISAGHTVASYENMIDAIAAGVSVGAHVFNASPGITAREPGPVAALLLHNDVTVELIPDGIHVHPALIKLVLQVKGTSRVCLVTDASPPSGTDSKEWSMRGVTITVRGYTNYLPDGTIAGSALTMGAAVSLMRQHVRLDLPEILPMAAANQAKLINIHAETGSLAIHKDADIVILSNDPDLRALATIVRGQVVADCGILGH